MSKIVKYERQESGAKEIRIRLPELKFPSNGFARYLMLGGVAFLSFLGAIVLVALLQPIVSALIPGPSKDAPGHMEPPADRQLAVGASLKSENDTQAGTPSTEPSTSETPESEPAKPEPVATRPAPEPVAAPAPTPAPPAPRASGPGNFDAPPAPYYGGGGATGPGNL